uniref:Trafficking protein particle complex subunit n=1 Tax=Chlamydomonas euryale TaxID=1486919 RepID=A0A6U2GSP5_9CHLO|mmetsp:Transcript_354/g.939  ORF Transcript_354/g.939 Transcript_354/m.939 type:complete len:203 (+) Transcript_354:232-840(+)
MAGRPPGGGARRVNVLERPLPRARQEVPTVSVSAFAFLTSEILQYTLENASSTRDLDERLDRIGFEVGTRQLELLSWRLDRVPRRRTEILDALRFIHSVAWPHLFGKTADDLQQAAAADDEYMISDASLPTNRFVSVPKSYGSFNPGALVAGIVRGLLDAAGFPAHVSAHFVEQRDKGRVTTTFLIKFDASVMQREAMLKRR